MWWSALLELAAFVGVLIASISVWGIGAALLLVAEMIVEGNP